MEDQNTVIRHRRNEGKNQKKREKEKEKKTGLCFDEHSPINQVKATSPCTCMLVRARPKGCFPPSTELAGRGKTRKRRNKKINFLNEDVRFGPRGFKARPTRITKIKAKKSWKST